MLSFTVDAYRLNPWLAPLIAAVTATVALLFTWRAKRRGTSSRPWLIAIIALGAFALLFLPYCLLWAACLMTGDCL